jgi:hypothetical protein
MFQSALRSWNRLVGRLPRATEVEEDRRVWVRYPCELKTTCQPADVVQPLSLSARVQNISRGGINLLVNCHFDPGAILRIDIPGTAGYSSIVLAYVVRVNPSKAGEYALGCTFASELGDDDLQRFPGRVKSSEPDQRTWVRFPCEAQASYQSVPGGGSELLPAQVLNISPSGVCLLVTSPAEIGGLLSVTLGDVRGEPVSTIMASVVRVTTQGNGEWALGCNFIRELNDRELRALV